MSMPDPAALLEAAAAARHHAHAAYSGFAVGAALRCEDGTVIPGCNVENASYGLTLCAERTAIVNAIAAGQRSFTALAVVADDVRLPYPCGACRQVLAELCPDAMPVYVARVDHLDEFDTVSIEELLPHAFRRS